MNKGEVHTIEPENGNPKAIIQTATGGHFNFDDPLSSDFNIMDIAHALSHIPRFAGHTRSFYSVAEHSTMVLDYLEKLEDQSEGELKISYETKMAALLHDAAEAFISDIPRPFKHRIPQIAEEEAKVLEAIITKLELDLDEADFDLVKQADNYMLMLEARTLLAPARQFRYVWGPQLAKHHESHAEMIQDEDSDWEMWFSSLKPGDACHNFLEAYNKLKWSKV